MFGILIIFLFMSLVLMRLLRLLGVRIFFLVLMLIRVLRMLSENFWFFWKSCWLIYSSFIFVFVNIFIKKFGVGVGYVVDLK